MRNPPDDQSTAELMLEPQVIKRAGGADKAETQLYAQAFRRLIEDGPFVWEMSGDQQRDAAYAFMAEWAKAALEDQTFLTNLLQQAARDMNRYSPYMPPVQHFQQTRDVVREAEALGVPPERLIEMRNRAVRAFLRDQSL